MDKDSLVIDLKSSHVTKAKTASFSESYHNGYESVVTKEEQPRRIGERRFGGSIERGGSENLFASDFSRKHS